MDKRLILPQETAQITLKFRRAGVEMRHVFYAQKKLQNLFVLGTPDHFTDDDANSCASQLFDAYKSAYQGAADGTLSCYGADWVYRHESDAPGVLHEGSAAPTPWSGTNTGHPAPNNVALCIKLGTGLGGRSNHGRFYFPGVNDGLYEAGAPNQLKAGSVVDFAAHNETFRSAATSMDDLVNLVGTGSVFVLSVVSFVSSGALRSEAQVINVTQVELVDTVFDSQRRRLPGRGA